MTMTNLYAPATQSLIAAYKSGAWQEDPGGDLTFRVQVSEKGNVIAIEPGSDGPGHPWQIGTSAIDDKTMLNVNIATAVYNARQEIGMTGTEISALNTRDRLNVWANEIFEQASDVGLIADPEIEAAVQDLSEAADRLSRLTYSDDE